ncbi:hypothetical protein PG991_001953 [Apiospora marii]|uniref:Zn(2)-C6 fungal-type domain-containing protein n=1 Tax=Apiospora marii TaxID=335849 RepID=A0ABR1SNI8_9PEZI
MSSATAGMEQFSSAPKHRACDECRSRKLACSKEADGCARCKREGIVCHYSPQKQMGRPRKRPREEQATNEHAASAGPTTTITATEEESPNKNPMLSVPPDTEDPGLAFLSFLSGGDTMFDASLPSGLLEDMTLLPPHEEYNIGSSHDNDNNYNTKGGPELGQFGYMDMNFGQVNFGGDAGVEQAPSLSSSNLDPALINMADTPPGSVPNMSSGSSASAESTSGDDNHNSPPTTNPHSNSVACACTANLYLALDSMQRLSNSVTEGIRQARVAAKTAYQVVNCPVCNGAHEHLLKSEAALADSMSHSAPRAMQNFQNLMLLGTLIPSIAHAYERILVLVDKEAARAQTERREIPFRMEGYGGLWGPLAEDDCCGARTMLEHRLMEPTIWRLTVRALLRVDVYGIAEPSDIPTTPIPRDSVHGGGVETGGAGGASEMCHLGLKDLVIQMEERSRARHAVVDPLVQAGKCGNYSAVLRLHKEGETPTCQRIIALARQAIDNLVIA